MTKKQRIEHKRENQKRKKEILNKLKTAEKGTRNLYNILGGFQDGKFS